MNIVRWNPVKELEEMSDRLNRLFEGDFKRRDGKEALTVSQWTPAVDICETEQEYLIKAELPEVKKEDVKVTAQEGVLTIQGERKAEKEEEGKKFHRMERSYGLFERSFNIPDNADETKVKAEFKDGMLSIHLPKTEMAKPKVIQVKVA